jgi:hypothetical protein
VRAHESVIEVFAAHAIAPDEAALSELERSTLATLRGERRRDQWLRSRLAIRRLLEDPGASVINDGDGAPLVVGASCHVSLSHAGDWIGVAVANATTRIGIDLALRAHGDRMATLLDWLGVRGDALDPVARWAALEAVLKLRRWPIEMLRDAALEVASADGLLVRGLGADARVDTRIAPDYVLAWTSEVIDGR